MRMSSNSPFECPRNLHDSSSSHAPSPMISNCSDPFTDGSSLGSDSEQWDILFDACQMVRLFCLLMLLYLCWLRL